MYSWAGANRFGDHGLFNLIRQGAVSTGPFSGFLISIFGSNIASFTYNGDSMVDGRVLAEFGFRVPLEKSNYVYAFGATRNQNVTIPYGGTFPIDPKTVDLVRLSLRASPPPGESRPLRTAIRRGEGWISDHSIHRGIAVPEFSSNAGPNYVVKSGLQSKWLTLGL